jgi:hypothetical protein
MPARNMTMSPATRNGENIGQVVHGHRLKPRHGCAVAELTRAIVAPGTGKLAVGSQTMFPASGKSKDAGDQGVYGDGRWTEQGPPGIDVLCQGRYAANQPHGD